LELRRCEYEENSLISVLFFSILKAEIIGPELIRYTHGSSIKIAWFYPSRNSSFKTAVLPSILGGMKKMGLPAKKDDRIYTYADYISWPEDERWELIDGVAYNMSPAPGRKHQGIVGTLFGELYQYLKGKPCDVYVSPFDVRLSAENAASNDDIINVVQPDVSVYCSQNKLDDAGAVGAPDLVAEVLSPATSVKDQREKLALYERFGVREYWIVDAANQTVAVYTIETVPDSARGMQARYGKPRVYGPEDTLPCSVIEGFELNLFELFD
jgi:Uma2 family endonuclease